MSFNKEAKGSKPPNFRTFFTRVLPYDPVKQRLWQLPYRTGPPPTTSTCLILVAGLSANSRSLPRLALIRHLIGVLCKRTSIQYRHPVQGFISSAYFLRLCWAVPGRPTNAGVIPTKIDISLQQQFFPENRIEAGKQR